MFLTHKALKRLSSFPSDWDSLCCSSKESNTREMECVAAFVKANFHTQSHLNNLPSRSDTLSLISYYAAINYTCKKLND